MSDMKITNSSGQTVATSLVVGDLIAINLVASKPDGSRMGAGGTFNYLGNAVNAEGKELPGTSGLNIALLSGTAAPEFNLAKYNELVEQGSIEAAEDLQLQYELDVKAWSEQGNQSLPDSIATAAMEWADRVHGVKDTDSGDAPFIKREQVVVKNVVRSTANEPGVFIVQLTPSWGE